MPSQLQLNSTRYETLNKSSGRFISQNQVRNIFAVQHNNASDSVVVAARWLACVESSQVVEIYFDRLTPLHLSTLAYACKSGLYTFLALLDGSLAYMSRLASLVGFENASALQKWRIKSIQEGWLSFRLTTNTC